MSGRRWSWSLGLAVLAAASGWGQGKPPQRLPELPPLVINREAGEERVGGQGGATREDPLPPLRDPETETAAAEVRHRRREAQRILDGHAPPPSWRRALWIAGIVAAGLAFFLVAALRRLRRGR